MATAVGTGRLLPDGRIGRMAVLRPWRGKGAGARAADRAAQDRAGCRPARRWLSTRRPMRSGSMLASDSSRRARRSWRRASRIAPCAGGSPELRVLRTEFTGLTGFLRINRIHPRQHHCTERRRCAVLIIPSCNPVNPVYFLSQPHRQRRLASGWTPTNRGRFQRLREAAGRSDGARGPFHRSRSCAPRSAPARRDRPAARSSSVSRSRRIG